MAKIEETEQKVLDLLDKLTVDWSDDDKGEVFDLLKNDMVIRLEELS